MSKSQDQFDVIIVGGGMSGGWAAKDFCDKGFKTLVLERCRDVKHITDYPTTNMKPWEFPNRGSITNKMREENPIVSKCYAFREDATHFFVKDKEHPYIEEKPFDWIRGYQVGGRSLMWARQTQRWSDYDFEGPARDGFAVDWPIRYNDLDSWYSEVEKFVGISGNKDGLDAIPDGEFLKAWELNCVEKHLQEKVKENYEDRHVVYARCAHITEMKEIFQKQGRGPCMSRNICQRGCPFGGYFSANSTLFPWALKTGNLTLRPNSVVQAIVYDEQAGQATGVKIVDASTKEEIEYSAKVIFVNAGTINTNAVLLNSTSNRFPNGLGNDSGTLGKYLGFHIYRGKVSANCEEYKDQKTEGGRPTSAYMPRFRNLYTQETDFLRGYAISLGAGRSLKVNREGIGQELTNNLMAEKEYGPWSVYAGMMGETIPKETNTISLDAVQKDEWGMPIVKVNIDYDENDEKMIADFFEQTTDMFKKAGFTNIQTRDTKQAPGLDIHEMGGVRMGRDAETSMLNEWNQLHHCKNVYVTDGACMTSMSTQNPSLTFLALTARAADHAMKSLNGDEM